MKRFISLVLLLALILSVFSFPVYAFEIDVDSWLSVYDLSYEFNTVKSIWEDYSCEFYGVFNVGEIYVTSYDCVIWDINGVMSSDSFDSVNLVAPGDFETELVYLGNNLYRAYGVNPQDPLFAADSFSLDIYFNERVSAEFEIVSLFFNTVPFTYFDIEAYCDILSYSYTSQIHYIPTDEINYREWEANSEFNFPFLQLDLFTSDWQKYDFVDFIVSLNCLSITSVSAFRDGIVLPLEYTVTENSVIGTPTYTLTLRLDLRGLDRSNPSLPNIHIEGQESPGQYNSVNVISCVGGVVFREPSLLLSLIDGIRIYIGELLNYIPLISADLYAVRDTVVDIFNALSQGDSDVDNIGQQVQDKDEQLQDMVAEMNSVTRPPIDDVDGDVSDFISSDDLVLASQGLGNLIQNEIIISIFSMSLLLCLASYVFFGKK